MTRRAAACQKFSNSRIEWVVGKGKWGRTVAGEAESVWGTGAWAMDWINYF